MSACHWHGTARHALNSTGYSFPSIPRLSSSCPSCSLLSHNLSPALRSPAPLPPVLLYSCLAVPLSCCTPVLLYPCPAVIKVCCTPVMLYSSSAVHLSICSPALLYSSLSPVPGSPIFTLMTSGPAVMLCFSPCKRLHMILPALLIRGSCHWQSFSYDNLSPALPLP